MVLIVGWLVCWFGLADLVSESNQHMSLYVQALGCWAYGFRFLVLMVKVA